MSSIMIFSPSWLESTFQQTGIWRKKKNIVLDITDKPNIFNVDLNNISLRLSYNQNKNTIIDYNKNRKLKLLKYYLLDDKKYYFTPKDFDNYLTYDNFDIENCKINSACFKNKPKSFKIQNNLYEKNKENIEYYFSCINNIYNFENISDEYDYKYDYKYEYDNFSDSDSDEFELC